MGGAAPAKGTWGLVGRAEELALVADLRQHLDHPGVLLTGEAGTGKSRLAREIAATPSHAAHVVTLLATPASAAVPYGALAALLPGTDETRWLDVLTVFRELNRVHDDVVVLVDDVNHLDDLSMSILHRCIAERLAFVVATARTGDDGDPDVVALWKDLGMARIDVRPLSRTETVDMVEHRLQASVDGVTARDIWTVTQGVPLYVTELVEAAIRTGALTDSDGVWTAMAPLPTPGSLRGMILQRLGALSPSALRAGQALAIAGRLSLSDLDALGLTEGLHELESAAVAAVAPGQPPSATLAHPLHGEIIRTETPGSSHLEAVGRLIALFEQRRDISVAERIALATWKLDVGEVDAELFDQAAHAAYRLGDFDLAERLATKAADAGQDRSGMLVAQILHERGDHEEADVMNRRLADRVDDRDADRVAVQRSVNLFFGLGDAEAALGVLAAADRRTLDINRSWILINMGRINDAASLADAARPVSDPLAWHVTRAWIDALGPNPESALASVEAARSLRSPDQLPSRFRDFPDIPLTLALVATGRLAAASDTANRGLEDSIDRHPMFIRSWWHLLLGLIALDEGRVDSAIASFERGAALQRRMNQPGLGMWFAHGSALARSQTADRGEVPNDPDVDRPERLFGGLLTEAQAWHRGRLDPVAGIAALEREAERLESDGLDFMATRLHLAAGRLGTQREHVGAMHPRRHLLDRLIAANRHPSPAAHTTAAQAAEAAGMHLIAAEAWGRLSVELRRTGDQRGATSALHSFERARRRCESADTPGLVVEATIDPLTDRERQVMVLAAAGTPSRRIAEELDVSVRTVNNQIQRAYVKLGVSSRSEAAVALGIDRSEPD